MIKRISNRACDEPEQNGHFIKHIWPLGFNKLYIKSFQQFIFCVLSIMLTPCSWKTEKVLFNLHSAKYAHVEGEMDRNLVQQITSPFLL